MGAELKCESETKLYAESNNNIGDYNLSWYTIMKSTIRFSSPAFFEPRKNLKLVPMGEETIKIEDGEIRLRGRLRISWGDLKTP